MQDANLSFVRFATALRMGLGNRAGDPKVAEALALFPKAFRHYSMRELLCVAERLRDIFGWETSLAESFGGHETVEGDEREMNRHGRGLTDEEIQREVEPRAQPEEAQGVGQGAGR